jgi:glycosyltransferase involved in cell wall biosynthesis
MSANANYFSHPSDRGQAAPPCVAILISAHEPGEALYELVERLVDAGAPAIIVVDDGTRAMYRRVFERIAHFPSVHVLRQTQDRGKGMALKTGIRYFLEHFGHYQGLVTAEADGRYDPNDILRVAKTLHRAPRLAVLGARSSLGRNGVSRARSAASRLMVLLFKTFTGVPVSDPQTGLRGLPTSLLHHLLELPGRRYEYEMAVMLHIARSGHPLAEQPIHLLREAENTDPSFRPVADSARILCALLTSPQPLPWPREMEGIGLAPQVRPVSRQRALPINFS